MQVVASDIRVLIANSHVGFTETQVRMLGLLAGELETSLKASQVSYDRLSSSGILGNSAPSSQ